MEFCKGLQIDHVVLFNSFIIRMQKNGQGFYCVLFESYTFFKCVEFVYELHSV